MARAPTVAVTENPAKLMGRATRGWKSSRCTSDGEMMGLPPTSFTKGGWIINGLFSAHAFGDGFKGIINRQALEETQKRGSLFDADAR